MKKNDSVWIYEYPITRKKLEGRARLIKQIREDAHAGTEDWMVEFHDKPGDETARTIKV